MIENYDKVIRKHKAQKGIFMKEAQEPSPFSLMMYEPPAGVRRAAPKMRSISSMLEEIKDFRV